MDFYFFIGEMGQPDEVIHSYQDVIGRPAMPPYWALGFHQCRWGYTDLQAVKNVVANFTKAQVKKANYQHTPSMVYALGYNHYCLTMTIVTVLLYKSHEVKT